MKIDMSRPGGRSLRWAPLGYGLVPLLLAAGLNWWPVPTAAAAVCAAGVFFSLVPAGQSSRFISGLLAALLVGYAFFGRGFAHLGLEPIYVGEVVLTLALLGTAVNGTLWAAFRSRIAWLLVAFGGWCALRTLPYLGSYGVDALRDGALWGYSAFAFLMAAVLMRRRTTEPLTRIYGRVLPLYLGWIVVAGTIRIAGTGPIAQAGQAVAPLVDVKGGDAAVHLAGGAAFLILGLHHERGARRRAFWWKEWLLWTLWTAGFLLFGSMNRGGLLSMLVSLSFVLLLWRRGKWVKLAVVAVTSAALFACVGFEFEVGLSRKVSFDQIGVNLSSITGDSLTPADGTRQWRLKWWQTILNYTIWGEYFWEGKGFGANLADSDGFQTVRDHSLRSPHNGHLTVLARAGVPGLALWILLQAGLSIGLIRAYARARRAGDWRRSARLLWLLAYWLAFTVNLAFDVYLEGPQGGIWFWAMVGASLAALREKPLPSSARAPVPRIPVAAAAWGEPRALAAR